jgi:hypothetical protein
MVEDFIPHDLMIEVGIPYLDRLHEVSRVLVVVAYALPGVHL